MHDEPIRICERCGAEYSAEATTCADCGGALVFPRQKVKPAVPLKENEADTLIRQGQAGYLRELARLLEKDGIRSDIRFHGCPPGT